MSFREEYLKQKIVIPSWLLYAFLVLSCAEVNFGFIYLLLLFLGVNKYSSENMFDGKTLGIPLNWPPKVRRVSEIVFWTSTGVLIVGAFLYSHTEIRMWLFSKLP